MQEHIVEKLHGVSKPASLSCILHEALQLQLQWWRSQKEWLQGCCDAADVVGQIKRRYWKPDSRQSFLLCPSLHAILVQAPLPLPSIAPKLIDSDMCPWTAAWKRRCFYCVFQGCNL